eukprot:Opistho-1_new@41389
MGQRTASKRKKHYQVNAAVSRTKKNRRGQNRHFKKVSISNPQIKAQWDDKLTLRQNMRRMGILHDPNEIAPLDAFEVKPKEYVLGENGLEEYEDDKALTSAEKAPAPPTELVKSFEKKAATAAPKPIHMAAGDAEFARACIRKYGEDYKAMARDLKLNTHQHTPKQLQKKCEEYLRHFGSASA